MAFGDSDLEEFLSDFGESATLKNASGQDVRSLKVLFDTPSADVRVFDASMIRPGETALAKTTDVSDAREGWLLNVRNADRRIAQKPRADSDGAFSIIELRG